MKSPTASALSRVLLVLVATAAVTVIVLGSIRTHQLHQDAHGNDALVDRAATTDVARQAERAMADLWSYDYRDLGRTKSRLASVSTPAFRKEYARVYRNVDTLAPQAQAVVSADVVDVGVESIEGDRAKVIVFLNQTAKKRATKQTSRAGARLGVEMVRKGDTWLVDKVTPF